MPSETVRWRQILMSYPCPDCDAAPGQPCITTGGRQAIDYVHAARSRDAMRCPKCGQRLTAEAEAGDLCDKCQLMRGLEVERYRPRPPRKGA